MSRGLSAGKSVAGSIMLTMATAVVGLLYLMFSTTGDEPVYRKTLFGSVFFKTQTTAGDGIGITMGVANPLALIFIFIVYVGILAAMQYVYRGLKRRREYLLQQGFGK